MPTVLEQLNLELTLFIAVNVVTCLWLLYLFFYNSKLTGAIATRLINKLVLKGNGYVKIGKLGLPASQCRLVGCAI